MKTFEPIYISEDLVITFTGGSGRPPPSVGVDLAVLSSCDAVIVSTGSFGWWAAWLANKTTVYYANWPRPGTGFDQLLNRTTYFPAQWIPMI